MSVLDFGFTRKTVLKYTRGDCGKLAKFLQKLIGGTIYGIAMTNAYDKFVLDELHWHFCVRKGKYFIDIEGIWRSEELIAKYRKYIISQQDIVDANDYQLALIKGEDVSNWKVVNDDDDDEDEDEDEEDEEDFQLFLVEVKTLSYTTCKHFKEDKEELKEIADIIKEKILHFKF